MKWIGPVIIKVLEAFFGSGVMTWVFFITLGTIVVVLLIGGICSLLSKDSEPQPTHTDLNHDNSNHTASDNDAPFFGNPNTCQPPDVIYL